MNDLIFYRPSAITLPEGITFPVFQFTEELRQLAPQVTWTIIGKSMAMLDCHVAQCYGKCNNSFQKQMERNREYFKSDWRFQPTLEEWKALKNIVMQRITDDRTKCPIIYQTYDNEESAEHKGIFSLAQIFGEAAKSHALPWFYSKKGINMAAFFQSTPIARMRAMYIIEAFDEFERAAFDPATDPQVQAYLQKVLAEKARTISIAVGNHVQHNTVNSIQILADLGFRPSLPNQMATKRDIAHFLDIPENTLTTFLVKHTDQIKPTRLSKDQIRAAGKKANRLNAYSEDDVFKLAFWMNTEISTQLKRKIFGDLGIYSTPAIREEIEWKSMLSKIFASLGFKYQQRIGGYVVDFFVEKLALVLECDKDNHRYYDPAEEKKRDKLITRHYSLIRFNSQISLETLVNAILRVQPKELVKLYLSLETKKTINKA